MKDDLFEELMQIEQNRPLPPCPPDLGANVLRRVRLALAESSEREMSAWNWLWEWLPQKTLGLSFIVAVTALSVFFSVVMVSSALKAETSRHLAVSSLDFGVFERAPILNFEN